MLSWSLDESDASCWRHPLTLTITPNISDPDWETVLFMSREEARLLRDFLTTLLVSPDLRQCEKGGEIKLHD